MAHSIICSICDLPIDIYDSNVYIVRFICGHCIHSECFEDCYGPDQNICRVCGLVSTSIFYQ